MSATGDVCKMYDPPRAKEWVVSERFHGGQRWIVHQRGPNRPNKLPVVFDSKRQAEAVAVHLNLCARPIL